MKVPPATPRNQPMAEGSRSILTKLLTMLKSVISGNLLTRNKRSQSSPSTHFEAIDGILHSVETPDQQNLQHNQRLTMSQTSDTTPAQSFAPQVGGNCSYHEGKGHQIIHC